MWRPRGLHRRTICDVLVTARQRDLFAGPVVGCDSNRIATEPPHAADWPCTIPVVRWSESRQRDRRERRARPTGHGRDRDRHSAPPRPPALDGVSRAHCRGPRHHLDPGRPRSDDRRRDRTGVAECRHPAFLQRRHRRGRIALRRRRGHRRADIRVGHRSAGAALGVLRHARALSRRRRADRPGVGLPQLRPLPAGHRPRHRR